MGCGVGLGLGLWEEFGVELGVGLGVGVGVGAEVELGVGLGVGATSACSTPPHSAPPPCTPKERLSSHAARPVRVAGVGLGPGLG